MGFDDTCATIMATLSIDINNEVWKLSWHGYSCMCCTRSTNLGVKSDIRFPYMVCLIFIYLKKKIILLFIHITAPGWVVLLGGSIFGMSIYWNTAANQHLIKTANVQIDFSIYGTRSNHVGFPIGGQLVVIRFRIPTMPSYIKMTISFLDLNLILGSCSKLLCQLDYAYRTSHLWLIH